MITNYLSPLEFEVTVRRLPHVEFFTQRVSVPGISATPATMPTPFNMTYFTPDKLNYDQLVLQFIVDEKMNNYMEVFNWIVATTFPQNYKQFKDIKDSKEGIFSDISIIIKSSSKNPAIEINFVNCQPIALSDVQLDTTQPDVVYPEAAVTFQYDSYSIKHYNT